MAEQQSDAVEDKVTEESVETTETNDEMQDEIASKEAELAQSLEELNQRYVRLVADFDNYRRRTAQEKSELSEYSISKLITALLPVLDNFERALSAAEANEQIKGYLKGMEMVYAQLFTTLEKEGLAVINAKGEIFDPKKHEAIMTVEDPDSPDDTVVEELQKGYTFKEKVIRPTMCKVSHK